MAHKLIRIYGRGHLRLITCSCYRRVPFLRSVRARNIFVQILGEVRDRYRFSLVGYVVMPEHVHLLIGEPAACRRQNDNAEFMADSKALLEFDLQLVLAGRG